MKARWFAIPLLLWLGFGLWSSGLDHPWRLMFESGGQFFSGVARVHVEKGLGFTRGHDWIFNEDNPYEWKGPEPGEARPYGHHPPAVGLSLAAVFRLFGQSRAAARTATIVSHLATLLLLVLAAGRWTRGSPAAILTGLVVVLVPMSGFFGRNVSHEAWVLPWLVLATIAYVRRFERGDDGTPREDAVACACIAVGALYDWPGFYLPPILVLCEILRGRPFSRLSKMLVATTVVLSAVVLGHLAWAAPDGLRLLTSGAEKRVDPRVMGFTRVEWLQRVRDFTLQTYTPLVTWAALAVAAAWFLRAAARRFRGAGPAGVFVAIWAVFGAIHVAAFPGGSWVHPYWMFYWMPAIAIAVGVGGGRLWEIDVPVVREAVRLAIAGWFVAVGCAAHATLVWWLAVGAHPTGNPFVEWPPHSPLHLACRWVDWFGPWWPFTGGAALLGSLGRALPALARTHPWQAAGWATGAALFGWLLRAGPRDARLRALAIAVALLAILLPITPRESMHDAAIRLAAAMLQGHVSLPERLTWLEMFRFGDRFYFPYPPMTSMVLVPWVAATFGHGSQALANTLFIVASAVLLHELVRSLPAVAPWALQAAFAYALCTPILYSAGVGNVWLLMHSEANFFLLLALWLGLVRGAIAWAGFFLMTGAQCRYSVIFAGLVFALRFLHESPWVSRWRDTAAKLVRFCLPMAIPLAATLVFQWRAFGHPLQTAYTLSWQEWGPHGPDFAARYFWNNFRTYMITLPEFLTAFPWVRFPPYGQSIWWMSPFFLGLFVCRVGLRWVREFLPSIALMAAFYNFYWWSGFAQYGTRYVQDAYPLLIPVALSAFTREGEGWARALRWLLLAAFAFNAYGAWVMLANPR